MNAHFILNNSHLNCPLNELRRYQRMKIYNLIWWELCDVQSFNPVIGRDYGAEWSEPNGRSAHDT